MMSPVLGRTQTSGILPGLLNSDNQYLNTEAKQPLNNLSDAREIEFKKLLNDDDHDEV